MSVRKQSSVAWLLLTFTLPTKRASQRVEVWRKLQRYGTVPLGNSRYLLPSNPANEERFQSLGQALSKYAGGAPADPLPHTLKSPSAPLRCAPATPRPPDQQIADSN